MSAPVNEAALLRLEEASMNAWPGLKTVLDDRWVVRLGEGYTKRANSISMLAAGEDIAERLARCSALFAPEGVAPCARVVDFAAASEAALDAAGFGAPFDKTVTLWRAMDPPPPADPRVELFLGRPTAEWLTAKDRLNAENDAECASRRKILAAIAVPIAYGGVRGPDGQYAALAYVALHAGLASLNMVVTDPAQRGQRLSQAVCETLLAWAHGQGMRAACLQTLEANTPARALYARMGFSGPLYAYHYRVLETGQ